MFDVSYLVNEISSGKATSLLLDGKCRPLSSGKVKVDKSGCQVQLGALKVRIDCRKDGGYFIFSSTLKNTGKKDLHIGDITLFTHKDRPGASSPTQRNVFAFMDTLCSENYVENAKSKEGRHTSTPLCLVYELAAGKCFFSAQRTFDKNYVRYSMQFDAKSGLLQAMDCKIPVGDYVLAPNHEITTDQVCIDLHKQTSPRDALNRWADMANRLYHPAIPDFVPAGFLCGWLISTKAEKTDSQIRRVMAAAGTLKKLGAEYIWTSIDNLLDGLPGNWLESNRSNFKKGVPAFLKEIIQAGFKPGLWIAPFLIAEGSKDFPKVRDFLLKDKNGEPESRFRWYWGPLDENGLLPKAFTLDSDRQEAHDYFAKVLETYTKWGVRYYMCDFISDGLHKENNPSTSFCQESYRRFLRGLSKHVSPDTFILSATGTSLTDIGAFQSSRIGMDYGEARQLEPTFPSYPANYIINGSFGSSGAPNKNAIQNLAMWGFAHNRFFQCNSNVMTVDKPIPMNEAIIAASLFGISPSPVFFQDDIERMSPERLALLKKVLPRCKGMPEASDLFSKTDADTDFLRIFHIQINKKWGSWTICAVFNLNDSFRKIELNAQLLGLHPKRDYWMYDFWDECYMGTFTEKRTVEIPAVSCKVFRFAEKLEHPWVLSTDFHVRQGDAELDNVTWDEKKMVLSGTTRRAAGEKGVIFVVSPDKWMERHFNRGMLVAKSALDNSLVIKLPISFKSDTQKWKIEFSPCNQPVHNEIWEN